MNTNIFSPKIKPNTNMYIFGLKISTKYEKIMILKKSPEYESGDACSPSCNICPSF